MARILTVLFIFFIFHTSAQTTTAFTPQAKKEIREKVVDGCRHAWQGYKQYAWGYDDLRPLTKKGKNWYSHSLLMTPVDAYDTFVFLGMKEEAGEAKKLILDSLSFNRNESVQVFEITIRLLAGLMTAYELDGNRQFLVLAKDLGDRLMPAFHSKTGMPYRYVHLQTGVVADSINNPAEIGTLLLEFGKLSKLTGDQRYYAAARKAILEVYNRRSSIGLVGTQIDVTTGSWTNKESHISGMIDSYYEYLYKGWILFKDATLKKAFDEHQHAIKKYLVSQQPDGWYLRHVDMNTGKELSSEYGALDAFYAGLCAYSGDIPTAQKIQEANYAMWTKHHMEPEAFDFKTGKIMSPYYILRPENLESCFYLYSLTKNERYLTMGKRMVDDILTHCRTPEAFAALKNVETYEQTDSMQSFLFAETFKYAWLLFTDNPEETLNKYVFNTEAHPFRK